MTNIPILETTRLLLRPLRHHDATAIQREFAHWEIVKYLDAQVPWPYPENGAEIFLRARLSRAPEEDGYHWAICLRADPDALIGVISLRPGDPEARNQRGFWIAQRYWGQGLISEAADRVTDFAMLDLGLDQLWIGTARANVASSRVKARQGFRLVEIDRHMFVSGEQDREVWRLDRADWIARRCG